MNSLLNDAQIRLQHACTDLNLSPNVHTFLKYPMSTVIVDLPVKMDDKSIRFFPGYRVNHSYVRGPAKGGLAISDQYTLDDVKAFAMLMTWKSALIGAPLGGSYGAIVVDPKHLSIREKERLVRRYTSSLMNTLGPSKDIPGPGINADAQVMAWIYDTYSQNKGKNIHQVVTGKPLELNGIVGRDQAIGLGINYILHELTRKQYEEIQGQSVVIQGFGQVGQNFALATHELGAKVIAISDSSAALYDPNGLDIPKLVQYKRQRNSLSGYSDIKHISNESSLSLECDYLIPCAIHNQITEANVNQINCRRIIEGANAAISYNAEQRLWERNIPTIPDIVANCGGLIVSYLEWVANIQSLTWELEEVKTELKRMILQTFNAVYAVTVKFDISFRTAAYRIAVERVANALAMRGIYP